MKINFYSDLHIEWTNYIGPKIDTSGDVIVLAGDIGNLIDTNWINSLTDKPIIYVMGNHEYYSSTYPDFKEWLKPFLNDNIHILDNESITVDGVQFHCASLWTNFRDNPVVAFEAGRYINDFRRIYGMSPMKMESEHYKSVDYLSETVKVGDVVVTHFAPCLQSVHPKYKDDSLNGYFVNDLEDFVSKLNPKLWIHGHTHSSFDYTLDCGTRVICNPRGYRDENPEFNPNMLIEI